MVDELKEEQEDALPNGRIDRWMDGWMADGRMDEWLNVWMDACVAQGVSTHPQQIHGWVT